MSCWISWLWDIGGSHITQWQRPASSWEKWLWLRFKNNNIHITYEFILQTNPYIVPVINTVWWRVSSKLLYQIARLDWTPGFDGIVLAEDRIYKKTWTLESNAEVKCHKCHCQVSVVQKQIRYTGIPKMEHPVCMNLVERLLTQPERVVRTLPVTDGISQTAHAFEPTKCGKKTPAQSMVLKQSSARASDWERLRTTNHFH